MYLELSKYKGTFFIYSDYHRELDAFMFGIQIGERLFHLILIIKACNDVIAIPTVKRRLYTCEATYLQNGQETNQLRSLPKESPWQHHHPSAQKIPCYKGNVFPMQQTFFQIWSCGFQTRVIFKHYFQEISIVLFKGILVKRIWTS